VSTRRTSQIWRTPLPQRRNETDHALPGLPNANPQSIRTTLHRLRTRIRHNKSNTKHSTGPTQPNLKQQPPPLPEGSRKRVLEVWGARSADRKRRLSGARRVLENQCLRSPFAGLVSDVGVKLVTGKLAGKPRTSSPMGTMSNGCSSSGESDHHKLHAIRAERIEYQRAVSRVFAQSRCVGLVQSAMLEDLNALADRSGSRVCGRDTSAPVLESKAVRCSRA
jgi:hypothetical protein